MKLDVHFGTAALTPAEVQNKVCAVVDVLRASTTVAVALAIDEKFHGAGAAIRESLGESNRCGVQSIAQ